MRTLILSCVALLSACKGIDPFAEIEEGETAVFYACGNNWSENQLAQFPVSTENWLKLDIMLWTGNQPIQYGGWRPEMSPYTTKDSGDKTHCAYLVGGDYPTEAGMALDNEHDAWGLYHKGDIFIFDVCIKFRQERNLPPDWPCYAPVKCVLDHELGHALGLEHVDPKDGDSVMWPKGGSIKPQALDREAFCASGWCKNP